MQQSNLNLIPSGDMPVIYASQYDKNRVIRFNLFEGEEEYTLTGTEIVKCNIRKNDEHIVVITPMIGANKYIDIYLTEQACACFGDNIGEITISSDEDNLIGTINFILKVERNPIQGGVTSASDIADLESQIEDIVHEVMTDDYYTKSEVDAALNLKANAADVYTKTQVDTALGLKADKSTTYTKTEVDTALALKADSSSVYTKSEVDTALASKANAADVYTKIEVDEMIDELYPVNTTSGSIANFNTSLEMPLVALSSTIVAQQEGSGTPSPSNPRSISGVGSVKFEQTGKNLFDKAQTLEEGNITDDGSIGTATGYLHTDYIKVNAGDTYTTSGDVALGNTRNAIACYNANKEFIIRLLPTSAGGWSFTIPSNTVYIKMNLGGSSRDLDTIQLEAGSTATAYSAYNAETKTIALGQTVYGGEVDAINGSASKTFDIVEYDGSDDENWSYLSSGYIIERPSNAKISNDSTPLCNMAQVTTSSNVPDGYFRIGNSYVVIRLGTGDSDVSAFKQFLSNNHLIIAYEMVTPVEIDITANNFTTIAGEQNIFSDSGDVSVSFKQGIQEYIDDKTGD